MSVSSSSPLVVVSSEIVPYDCAMDWNRIMIDMGAITADISSPENLCKQYIAQIRDAWTTIARLIEVNPKLEITRVIIPSANETAVRMIRSRLSTPSKNDKTWEQILAHLIVLLTALHSVDGRAIYAQQIFLSRLNTVVQNRNRLFLDDSSSSS